jgi:hypothetical protein
VLLLPPGKPPELVDLKRDSAPVSLPELGSSTNVLGWFGTNILCHWNGTNQILVRELRGAEFIQRGAIALDSGTRPTGLPTTPRASSWRGPKGLLDVGLSGEPRGARPSDRTEERCSGLVPFRFSEDGNYWRP